MTLTAKERRFVWLSVIFAIIVAVVLAEFSLGVMEKYKKKATLDFADIKRLEGLGWGGISQGGFNGLRDRRSGRQGALDQQCGGISQ
jgi:hypothetical protein